MRYAQPACFEQNIACLSLLTYVSLSHTGFDLRGHHGMCLSATAWEERPEVPKPGWIHTLRTSTGKTTERRLRQVRDKER